MYLFPKIILIDPENVLFPANEVFYDAINLSFIEITNGKIKIEKETYRKFLAGASYDEILDFILTVKTKPHITIEDRQKIINKFIFLCEKILLTSKKNGTRKEHLDVFKWIVNAGSKIIICTNVNHELIMKYFDAVGYHPFFEKIITPNNVDDDIIIKSKPSTEMYEHIIKFFNISKDDIFSIEGTTNGISSAKNIGMKFIVSTKPENLNLRSFVEAAQVKELLTIQ